MAQLVMRQFDVVENPSEAMRGRAPYLVVLQSHLLAPLGTRIVAPMIHPDMVGSDGAVALKVDFSGQAYTLAMALIANVEARRLGRSVGDLRAYEYEIRRALDRLFTGF